ncbi:hypothetical protein HZ326_14492 [Fusarium oxysporum f. sp. albedinis]|nr:hypothetical protein HZ326_14492 [Fusarium oxysporum f. sp. albedinis]
MSGTDSCFSEGLERRWLEMASCAEQSRECRSIFTKKYAATRIASYLLIEYTLKSPAIECSSVLVIDPRAETAARCIPWLPGIAMQGIGRLSDGWVSKTRLLPD